MTRFFLDSNVLFTAARNPEGRASLVIELAGSGSREVLTSPYCVAEARLNLERKDPSSLDRLDMILRTIRLVPDVAGERCALAIPDKDRPVFGAAHRCKATPFPTGDRRHFGPFMNRPKDTMGIVVQTVGDFPSDITR